MSGVGDEGGVVPAGIVGWSLWMLVLLRDCGLPQCVAWSLPPRTPSETLSRGRRALSYRADVLLSRNWNPPGSLKGGTMVHAPCGGEAGGPRAL